MNVTIIKSNFLIIGLFFLLGPIYGQLNTEETQTKYRLIAHRGGVVDSLTAENSLSALQKASKEGYWMVEVDLRLTRDSILIIHHDPNFKRYFGVDKAVSEMDWSEIKELVGNLDNKVLTFEEALRRCQEGNLQVMIDNKISGNDTVLFGKVVELIKKYERSEQAMMIGTTESTPFFTGKIKLSCTRQQLEDNMLKPGFKSEDYYLFSKNITKEDVEWTKKHGILAVGVLNAWTFRSDDIMEEAKKEAEKLKEAGVGYYQLDSMFDFLFR
ncbi:glycerophosphodiester phosphodiesterase [Parapedobacter sp. DT-150]|uniref:glycerophosphodiester phosphodiesterase n=1 Tax=Parapedobacter sp. DT-150 TaxID=3396162 RepID=UPI003F1C9125